jgi:hypothetical protein
MRYFTCYYSEVEHAKFLRSAHTVYLCVLYGSQNEQRLLPYKALILQVFITEAECVYYAVRIKSLNINGCNIFLRVAAIFVFEAAVKRRRSEGYFVTFQ